MKIDERKVREMVLRKRNGITLVALVVTIVILIILATISMVALFGENGLITKTQKGRELHEQGKLEEQNNLDMYMEYTGNYLNGVSAGIKPEMPKGPNGKPLVNKDAVGTTEHKKIVGEDTLGNQVVVPNGFKIAEESGTSVKEGIIIEDEIGNQFVWVPVSNINGDGTGKIKVNSIDEDGAEITLGRYTFARTKNETTGLYEDGTPTIVQKASEYDKTINESNKDTKYKIKGGNNYHYEFSEPRLTNYKKDTTGINTTAKDLKDFIESVRDNHGFYIARYEASFASGEANPDASKIGTAEYITNQKPLSKESINHTRKSATEQLEEGMLWNYINQGDAAKVCRNMYTEDTKAEVTSDLVNSYAWDTTIIYIQAMGHTNYANADRNIIGNSSIKNTGETGDEKCHVYDMAGNCLEWTTEYSALQRDSETISTTPRGGNSLASAYYTSMRSSWDVESATSNTAFRPLLYF